LAPAKFGQLRLDTMTDDLNRQADWSISFDTVLKIVSFGSLS
jgi:hypothetical protein